MKVSDTETSFPPPYDPSAPQDSQELKPGRQGGTEPRYIYYRVYATDGAIPSKRVADPRNPFIGRIKATSVPPPLTVASLKRTLAQAEWIPDPFDSRTVLYGLPSHHIHMDDSEPVSILGVGPGIASTPEEALALVIIDELTDEEKQSMPLIHEVSAREDAQCVYYRLHTRSGEDYSEHSFDPDEPAIGYVDWFTIAPPRNALAVKRCIARAEGKPIYAFADLYADVSDGPLANDAGITIGAAGADFHGSSPTDALRIVRPERRPGLYNRPLKIVAAQPSAYISPQVMPRNGLAHILPWLEVSAGEIVYTDGIVQHADDLRMQILRGADHRRLYLSPQTAHSAGLAAWLRKPNQDAYVVVNSNGVEGMIHAENVKFLDE